MDLFGSVDWGKLLMPDTPLLEIFVRGTVMYLGLFLLLRLVLKRQSGGVGITDLLLIVLLADAAQNAMAGDYTSVTDGFLLVVVIVFWSYALDWLGYHVPLIHGLVHPEPLLLVKDGQMQRQNMRRELITKEELMSELREQGLEDVSQVKEARMEGDGRVSIIKMDGEQHEQKERPTT